MTVILNDIGAKITHMKKSVFISLFILLALSPLNSHAWAVNSKELYEVCAKGDNNNFCYGYLSGVFDSIIEQQHVDKEKGQVVKKLCIHRSFTPTKLKNLFLYFIDKNPEQVKQNYSASSVIANAIYQEFACQ